MQASKRVQVLVAGAGPVGSVAAICLAQQGIEVMLVENGMDCAQDLRASTFHPPTLEMLDTLGFTDRLLEIGLKAPVYHWRDRKTSEIFSFDMSELSDVTRFPFRLQCEQYHLSRMLSAALANMPTGEVRFGSRVVHIEQDDSGVNVALETATAIEHVRADYVIAADGASSIVRKWLGIEFDGFTYPEKFLCLTTDKPLEDYLPGLAYVNYVSDPDEWLVILRVPSLWRVLVPAEDADDSADLQSDAKAADVFGRLIGTENPVETRHRTIYRVHQRVAKQFQVGRIFLAGDAAHLNNPIGGFGMNSGIHDAFNLTEKLTDVIKGGANAETLTRYDRQRRKMTHDFIQAQTIQNMELMRGGQGEAHARRREAMRKTAENAELRRAYMLRQSMIDSLRDAEAIQ